MGPSIGPWRLRFLVIDGDLDSKLFLTSHGVDKVAMINPKGGSGQQWFFLPVEGKRDWYIITPEPAAICPPGLARKDHSEIVILAAEPDEWRLQYIPVDLAGGEVYEIHSKELIGAELLLGKEKKNDEAAIQAFVVGYDGPKPAWQFQPFNE